MRVPRLVLVSGAPDKVAAAVARAAHRVRALMVDSDIGELGLLVRQLRPFALVVVEPIYELNCVELDELCSEAQVRLIVLPLATVDEPALDAAMRRAMGEPT